VPIHQDSDKGSISLSQEALIQDCTNLGMKVEIMRRYGVIVDKCIKDLLCISRCLRKAIHPLPNDPGFSNAAQLFINPDKCIGCGTCMSACKSGAIFELGELPDGLERFAAVNAAYYNH
jgi:NAD-dependent dihydropyrimidine dehydrogenase PreA subunit